MKPTVLVLGLEAGQKLRRPVENRSAYLSDKEAGRVVLPKLGTLYRSHYDGGGPTGSPRLAKRWPDGSPVVDSDGTGRLHGPRVESIAGDSVERYLAAMGAAGCCTRAMPCERHRPALCGRDWETGKVRGEGA